MIDTWKRADLDELKSVQLSILKVVHKFCIENDIAYWIDCGTLLGAVRHKGYIPWDDDVDIGMLRPDYDRFMATFNEKNDRYKFYSIENNKEFLYPYGKVLDTETLLYEPDEKGNKLSINIDIFVYDNAPDDEKEVKRAYDKRDRLWHSLAIISNRGKPQGNLFRRIAIRGRRLLFSFMTPARICKNIANNSKRYQNCKTENVGDFISFARVVCPKTAFSGFIDVEFEGELFKAPIGYDKWLTILYGDYMKLPPVEKRETHHSFVAYIRAPENV